MNHLIYNLIAVLTYPPITGPTQRARLTILWAMPLAYPTASGGVTVDES